MAKVLVATEKPFAAVAVQGIREVLDQANFELTLLENYTSEDELIRAAKGVDAIIFRSDNISQKVIDAADKLKIAIRAGAGYDNIDLKAATARQIVVMNTPGQNSNAVAELALGMMVYMARNLYNGKPGAELKGKTLGIHAYGYVGKSIAKIAKGFGMDLYGYDPFIDKINMENDDVKVVEHVQELYKTCQYVSINIPANEQTKNSINYDLMRMMPKGATLINTARKEVVDEESLLKILDERSDFRYLSDIAPDCHGEIAQKHSGKYFFTPKKMGAQTAEANINAGIAAAKQIVGFITTGDTTFKVN